MGSRLTQKAKDLYYRTWHDNHERGVYQYKSYKLQYITICRWMPGEIDPLTRQIYTEIAYIPTINGTRLNDKGGGVRTEDPFSFKTLEEAKAGAMNQIDKNIEFNKAVRYIRGKY